MTFAHFFYYLDAGLISLFRLVDLPIAGYYIGIALICLACVILGQFTLSIAFRFNEGAIRNDNRQMVRMHNLSVRALAQKDKGSYTACNKQANDAFGKVFFSQIALGISSLWPVPFALSWMQFRFFDVGFPLPVSLPLVGDSVGYMSSFIPMYILVYIGFLHVKGFLPYFREEKKKLDAYAESDKESFLSFADLAMEHSVSAGRTDSPKA